LPACRHVQCNPQHLNQINHTCMRHPAGICLVGLALRLGRGRRPHPHPHYPPSRALAPICVMLRQGHVKTTRAAPLSNRQATTRWFSVSVTITSPPLVRLTVRPYSAALKAPSPFSAVPCQQHTGTRVKNKNRERQTSTGECSGERELEREASTSSDRENKRDATPSEQHLEV
jgi:hypothetical protein